ncbi:MAG: PilZ domain-containing protein [Candidatus Omnitrophota bacterium]
MKYQGEEKRKYTRYGTEVKVYFHVDYELKTKIKFQVIDKCEYKYSQKKYLAISRDISAEGIGFISNKKLESGDFVYLELYLPEQKKPICMIGEVRWSEQTVAGKKSRDKFTTGVRLISVSGKLVSESIYFDEKNHLYWSIVLESVFGTLREIINKKHVTNVLPARSNIGW